MKLPELGIITGLFIALTTVDIEGNEFAGQVIGIGILSVLIFFDLLEVTE